MLSKINTKGYSLIELIITITLTSIVMVIFYTVFGQTQVKSVSPIIQVKAAELGQAYLEEISLKRFDELSPIGNATPCTQGNCTPTGNFGGLSEGETRVSFDDVDDYHNLLDSPPVDATNNVRSGFSGFSVAVQVAYSGADFGLPSQSLKTITVTVTPPSSEGGSFVFSQYRGNF
jgi:MSHA pilin protein MshD